MGVIRRNSIRTSLIQYIGVFLGYANLVILYPHFLEPDQFGLTRILLSVTIVISQFSQFGTPSMIIRFFPKLQRRTFTIGIWVCTVGLLVTLSLFYLFRNPVANYYIKESSLFVDYFYLLIPFSIAMVFYNLFDAYLKAFYKNVLSASMPFIVLRILWMALILIYATGSLDFDAFIILYALSYSLIMVITLIYIMWMRLLPGSLTLNESDRSYYAEISRFNTFNILSGLSAFLINKVDVLMLGGMMGLEEVGVYSIAAALAAVIRIPATSIARTAPSVIAESFHRNDIDTIASLYRKSAITQFILSAGAFLLIFLNYDLLLVFLSEEYAASLMIFLFLGLAQVVDTGLGVNGYIMVNSIYYRVDAFLSVLLLILTVGTNKIFIPVFGVMGAALATFLSIVVYNLIRLIYLKVRLRIQPFTMDNFRALLLFVVAGLIAWFIPFVYSVWLTSFLKSAVFLSIAVPGIYHARFSPELNELLESGLKRFRK